MTKQPTAKNNLTSAAILTLCNNCGPSNYGQMLQCYAMVKLFASLGTDPYVVLYRKKDEKDSLKHNFSLKNPIGRWLNTHYETYYKERNVESRSTRTMRFEQFIQDYIPHTTPCYTKDMVEYVTKDSNLLICGSDQIWQPLWFGSDHIWQLDFGTDVQRRIAYAPSGIFYEDESNSSVYQHMIPSIEKLDYVTLREEIGLKILSKYTDKPMRTAPDPTLLLSQEDWNSICAPQLIEGDYIFCYTLGIIRPYPYILRQLSEAVGIKKIIYIPTNLTPEGIPLKMESYPDVGPMEFLSLIRHARAVCTDSFHGTVFSILFEKPFYNLRRTQYDPLNPGKSERISNLLGQLGIPDRTVDNAGKLKHLNDKDFNYPAVREKLQNLRNFHISELKKILR